MKIKIRTLARSGRHFRISSLSVAPVPPQSCAIAKDIFSLVSRELFFVDRSISDGMIKRDEALIAMEC